MIYDNLVNVKRYLGIHPNLDIVINWLLNNDYRTLAPGKTLIANEDVFVINLVTDSFEVHHGYYETHQHYGDLHVVVDHEQFFYTNVHNLKTLVHPYEAKTDLALYQLKDCIKNSLHPEINDFLIFFPNEAHGPKIQKQAGKLNKILFKFKV